MPAWAPPVIIVALTAFFFRQHLLGSAWLWEDFLYYSYPVRAFAATSLASGDFPLWNPYTFGGMPFFADIQTNVLYLPCLLLTLAAGDGTLHPYWLQLMIILHYVLAALGMYALARSLGLRRLPALFAGLAYAFSAFTILHAIHQMIITMVAWFPIIFLLFRRALASPGWFWVCAAGAVLGHSVLAGFPQLTLYLYFFLFAYLVYEVLTTYRSRAPFSRAAGLTLIRAGAVVLLSLGLTAVQLLPTMELADFSQRAAITYEKATEGQMSWGHLLTLIVPKFFGVADASSYAYWGPGVYWYFWETCIYRGGLPLVLMLLTIPLWKKSPVIPFLWGFSAFAFLFAVGDNFVLHRFFYEFVPGFRTFRCPARMLAFFGLAASLLPAFTLQHLLYEEPDGRFLRAARTILIILGGGAAALWLLLFSGALEGAFPFLTEPDRLAYVRRETILSLGLFLAALTATAGLLFRWRWMSRPAFVLVALFFLEMTLFGGSQNSSPNNPAEYFRRAGGILQFVRQDGGAEFFRVNSRNERGMLMDRNQGMVDRVFLTEGYTPLALQWVYPPVRDLDRLHDLLNVKYGTALADDGRRLALVRRTGYLPRASMVYATQTADGEEAMTAALNDPEFDPRRVALVEAPPPHTLPPSPDTSGWTAEIREYGINEILLEVATAREGLLVLSEIWYPGWRATVGGAPAEVHRVNYNLRGIFVPAGSHIVAVAFRPEPLTRGLWISLGFLLLCLAGLGTPLLRRRTATAEA